MEHSHPHQPRVTQLLKTAKGQVEGIIKMYEDHRYCVDISKQILAVISLLQQSNALILNDHINTCVKEAILENKGKEKIDEITEILTTYLK